MQYISELKSLIGEEPVVHEQDVMAQYLTDHRNIYHGNAIAILRPKSVGDVSKVVKYCNEEKIGIVPQGGNTSYSGGATPDNTGTQIILSLEKLNQIREIDTQNSTATIEAGVILENIQTEVNTHELFFPLEIGAKGSCQLGGNLSTNAGGTTVVKYGNTRDLVLGIEAVLGDGTVINGLKKLRKDNTGYDLKNLLIGSEGTLGIITAAVVKLFPRPKSSQTALLAVNSMFEVCQLFEFFKRNACDVLTTFEYISKQTYDLVFEHNPTLTDPFAERSQHYVLLELNSISTDDTLNELFESLISETMESGVVIDGTLAQSSRQREEIWKIRESIPEAEMAEGGSVKHDISLPISNIASFIQNINKLLFTLQSDVRISVYGHIGDGNLHFNLMGPVGKNNNDFKLFKSMPLSDEIYSMIDKLGGSFSAEHGVGQSKIALLNTYKDPGFLCAMYSIKNALDPNNIMNPGKLLNNSNNLSNKE